MVELHDLYTFLYAATAILASVVVRVAWSRRVARGAKGLALLMLGIAIWSVGAAAMWSAPTQEEQVFWLTTNALGIWMVPVGVLLIGLDVAKLDRWLTPWRVALISAPAFILMNLEWFNPGGLYNTAFVARVVGSYTHYETVPGPLYWTFNALAYVMMLAGLALMLRTYLRASGGERTQGAFLFFGGLLPLASDAVTESRLLPLAGLDIAPLSFLITGSVWLYAISRGGLLDVLPVACGTLVEQMLDGVLVLDVDDRVMHANPAALSMLGLRLADTLGSPAEEVLGGMEGASVLLEGGGTRHAILPLVSGGDYSIEIAVTPITIDDRSAATLVTLHDVTEERRANERLQLARTVFDTVNEGLLVATSGEERILDVNDAYCRMTGRSREELLGGGVSLRTDKNTPESYQAIEEALLATGEWNGEVIQERTDGTALPAWASISLIQGGEGGPGFVVVAMTDLTAIRAAEQITESEILYRTLTEVIPDLVFVIDGDSRVVTANSAAGRFVDRSVEELKGAPVSELFGGGMSASLKSRRAEIESRLRETRSTNQPREYEASFVVGEQERWLRTSVVPLAAVKPGYVLAVSRDITDSKRLEAALRAHAQEEEGLATHDSLTGLVNRRAFMTALDRALAVVRRGYPSTVLFMDINNFKRCNDERGHAFGDEVLISVARLLEEEAREVDLVARVGGDEYVALLAGTDEAGAQMVASRMKARVQALGAEIGIPVGLSVGVAAVEAEGSAVHIVSTADQRMYADKNAAAAAPETVKKA